MKTLLTFFALAAVALVFSPQQAQAGYSSRVYVSSYSSCGCPVYTKRVFCHYDCHGHAVYKYYRQPVRHHCHGRSYGYSSHNRYSSGYRSHYSRHYSSHNRYRSSCSSGSKRYSSHRSSSKHSGGGRSSHHRK